MEFSHLLIVRAKGTDSLQPPNPPPYSQPDRKKTVFDDFSVLNWGSKLSSGVLFSFTTIFHDN